MLQRSCRRWPGRSHREGAANHPFDPNRFSEKHSPISEGGGTLCCACANRSETLTTEITSFAPFSTATGPARSGTIARPSCDGSYFDPWFKRRLHGSVVTPRGEVLMSTVL